MNIDEYFSSLKQRFSPIINQSIVEKRYEAVIGLVKGSVAVTPNCWLNLPNVSNKRFDTIIASDEYLTYASNERDQIERIISLCNQATKRLIVTVRDFKNDLSRNDNDRNFVLQNDATQWLTVEQMLWDKTDRQSWSHQTYVISHNESETPIVSHHGSVMRRALYFKQLAKFSFDAGSSGYQVMPQIMYRPLFKKHAEHVIVIDF